MLSALIIYIYLGFLSIGKRFQQRSQDDNVQMNFPMKKEQEDKLTNASTCVFMWLNCYSFFKQGDESGIQALNIKQLGLDRDKTGAFFFLLNKIKIQKIIKNFARMDTKPGT